MMNKFNVLFYIICVAIKVGSAQSNKDKCSNFKAQENYLKSIYIKSHSYSNSTSATSISFELYTSSNHTEIKVNDTIVFYTSEQYLYKSFTTDSILVRWSFYHNHKILFGGSYRKLPLGWTEGAYLKRSRIFNYKRYRPKFRLHHKKHGIYIYILYFNHKKEIYKLISECCFSEDCNLKFIRVK